MEGSRSCAVGGPVQSTGGAASEKRRARNSGSRIASAQPSKPATRRGPRAQFTRSTRDLECRSILLACLLTVASYARVKLQASYEFEVSCKGHDKPWTARRLDAGGLLQTSAMPTYIDEDADRDADTDADEASRRGLSSSNTLLPGRTSVASRVEYRVHKTRLMIEFAGCVCVRVWVSWTLKTSMRDCTYVVQPRLNSRMDKQGSAVLNKATVT